MSENKYVQLNSIFKIMPKRQTKNIWETIYLSEKVFRTVERRFHQ